MGLGKGEGPDCILFASELPHFFCVCLELQLCLPKAAQTSQELITEQAG